MKKQYGKPEVYIENHDTGETVSTSQRYAGRMNIRVYEYKIKNMPNEKKMLNLSVRHRIAQKLA